MIRNLHLTLIEGACQGIRNLAGRGAVSVGGSQRPGLLSLLGNPEGSGVTLDPDNPEGSGVTLDPDNPEGSGVTLDPDNPEGSGVTLDPDNPEGSGVTLDPDNPEGRLYAMATQGGVAVHCGCGCDCQHEGERPQRPGIRPSDYSGYVIVRTADWVDDSESEYLHDLADKLGLEALKRVLEVAPQEDAASVDGADAGDTANGGNGGSDDWQVTAQSADAADGSCGRQPPPEQLPERGPRRYDDTLVCFPEISLGGLDRRKTVATIKKLEAAATQRGYQPLSSLSSYWRLDPGPRSEEVEELVEKLTALPEVELAYRELTVSDPLADDQNYYEPAPVGTGLRQFLDMVASPAGGLGTAKTTASTKTITLCDLEQQWQLDHESFSGLKAAGELELQYGANRDDAGEEDGYGHHGNAVLGQLVGDVRIRGGLGGFARCVLASHYWSKQLPDGSGGTSPFAGSNGHVAAAIVNSLAKAYSLAKMQPGENRLDAGDVLLLEVQRGGYPTEVDPLDLDAIRLASALGVTVVEAAGNGGHDLDAYVDPDTGRSLNRRASTFRDSGAIFVGAAYSALPHDRAPFSNHGSRLDCFAWGTGVTTCGYGNLAGDDRKDLYTNSFNGTSSAAPVVAAVAAAVQWHHCGVADRPIGVAELRRLLSDPANGTRQGGGVRGHIGVMPDLDRLLRRRLALVPDVYLRRHVGDDGSTPGVDESISSSPDLVVAKADAATPALAAEIDLVAPGGFVAPGEDHRLAVRLRNRGLGTGRVTVHAFACPATTLVTPELWQPVGTLADVEVPPGDQPVEKLVATVVTPPVPPPVPPPVTPPGAQTMPLAFLAVAVPAQENETTYPPVTPTPVLPPGPPYFDWREYRRFLRSPGVALRNVHRVKIKKTKTELPFFISGTPDVSRRFDFEVVQRLPEGSKLSVWLHRDAADKLMQRQPSLGKPAKVDDEPAKVNDDPEDEPVKVDDDSEQRLIGLPRRPRLPIEHVALNAGGRVPATFVVKSGDLAPGHSLAVRQLWRGVEVGRITWYFE